jgi:hypothetical protein
MVVTSTDDVGHKCRKHVEDHTNAYETSVENPKGMSPLVHLKRGYKLR